MCRYEVFEEGRVLEGSQEYIGYGICVVEIQLGYPISAVKGVSLRI